MVMTIVLIVVIVVFVLLAALFGYAATKPDTFRIQRSASMKAPPERIFPHINDFHRWGAWSPWEKIDPALQRTYSGAADGQGAVYAVAVGQRPGRCPLSTPAGQAGPRAVPLVTAIQRRLAERK